MAKNIEDIIPSNKRSIRNIPIPSRRNGMKGKSKTKEEGEEVEIKIQKEEPLPVTPRSDYIPPRRNKPSKKVFYLGGSVGLIFLIFVLLAVFDGSTLTYSPKTESLTFSDDSYTIYQTPEENGLLYSVVKLSGEKSVEVQASGEETVSERASGTVIIYNEQNSAQTLVATTRLETPDGKIYRIPREVNIPAKGSVESVATADVAGPSYNIGLSDFTIPGFEGSAKFDVVYARSKTAMTGGFTGTRKSVSDDDLSNARSSLEESLRTELSAQARAQMPADFVLFPELSKVVYEILPIEDAGATKAKITLRGHLEAVIFKRADLSKFLAEDKLTDVAEAEILDFSSLNITFAPPEPTVLSQADSLDIMISGSATAYHLTDEAALANDLRGVRKSGVEMVLEEYPSIDKASVAIKPFWKSSFPNDASEIKIVSTHNER